MALAWCRAVAERRYKLPGGQLRNLAVAADVHERHLVALSLPSPETRPGTTGPPTSGSPSPGAPSPSAPSTSVQPPALPEVRLPDTQAAAMKALGSVLGKVRAGHLDRSASADGSVALLWACLAAAAAQGSVLTRRSSAVAAPPDEPEHPPYRAMTPTAAAQALLAQLHAIVFGYQVALTPLSGDTAEPHRARLAELRQHRDVVATVLRDLDAEVPAAEPEYDTGGRITTDKAAVALVARMEHALLPHLGNWVAATEDGGHRRTAAGWLGSATADAVRAGATTSWWPGWPD